MVETRRTAMKRSIIGFSEDDRGHWRAKLDCGHFQHVRHDPPLMTREWVLTEEGRKSRVGEDLDCIKCIDEAPPDFQQEYDTNK